MVIDIKTRAPRKPAVLVNLREPPVDVRGVCENIEANAAEADKLLAKSATMRRFAEAVAELVRVGGKDWAAAQLEAAARRVKP